MRSALQDAGFQKYVNNIFIKPKIYTKSIKDSKAFAKLLSI